MKLFDLLGNSASDAAENVISFSGRRHKLMADNVANIDTPGYRMKDLSVSDFESALARAIERGKQSSPSGRIGDPNGGRGSIPSEDAERLKGIVFHDDNNRSVERLIVQMTTNGDRYRGAINLLRTQRQLLRAVISETTS